VRQKATGEDVKHGVQISHIVQQINHHAMKAAGYSKGFEKW
jgi:hypothetical protein